MIAKMYKAAFHVGNLKSLVPDSVGVRPKFLRHSRGGGMCKCVLDRLKFRFGG